MKQRLISLIMVFLGIAAGAQAGGFSIGGYTLSVGDYFSGESGLAGLSSGHITFTDATHVTLENVELYFNSERTAISSDIPYLVITLIGENKILGPGVKTGLYLSYTTSIIGDGSLDIVAVENGIEAVASAGLTITDAHVKAKGGKYGLTGARSTLTIKGDGILEAYGGTKCVNSFKSFSGGTAVTAPAGATFNSSVLSVVDEYNNPIKNQWVTIQKAVLVNETNFPDENFRNWILKQEYGKDGLLTDAEIAAVTEITVSYMNNIASLKGIEFFTALKKLYCDNNKLKSLDVSKNTALTYLSCGRNQLTSLDVSKNTALTKLWCYVNQLKTLDVSKNTDLTSLLCNNNELTSLDVSECTALVHLTCYNNQLISLNVSKNAALKELECYKNQLTSLDVSKNTALTYLYCDNNQLTSLDVSTNTALLGLICNENQLTSLDVSNNTALTNLYCYGNNIHGESMTTLVKSLPRIDGSFGILDDDGLFWAYQGLTPIDNKLTAAQVKIAKDNGWKVRMKNESNDWIDYEGEPVVPIDEMNFPDANFRNWVLSQTYGADGYLDDEEIAAVKAIDVSNKNIANLKGIEHFTAVTYLDCSNNQLDGFDVSKNTNLNQLFCSYNMLGGLDVSKNTALSSLGCDHNQLTALDVSQNTALTILECFNNKLTALEVSQNSALTDLYCYDNRLPTLDVSKNKKLRALTCYHNAIRGEGMDALVGSLSEEAEGQLVVYKDETIAGNVITTLQVAVAKGRKWKVMRISDIGVPEEYEGSPVIAINEENFPDEKFRNWVNDQPFSKDGYLDVVEIADVTEIDVSNKGITSLKGIEHFTALLTLQCSMNSLTALDLSKNTALTNLDCSINNLSALDLSQNTALQSLSCILNNLSTLDLSKNTALTWVACNNNAIRGEGMEAFVNNLPTVTSGELRIFNKENAAGNEMTTLQVAAAKAKKWKVLMDKGSGWEEYTGTVLASGLAFSVATADATYGADFTAPTLTNPNGLTVTYTSSNGEVATVNATTGAVAIAGAGTAIISAAFAGNDIYEAATVSYTLTVAKAVPTVTAPKAIAKLVANGSAQALVTAGSTTGGEMQYSLDGSAWSTAIPTGTDAGTYTVHYKVVGNKNYKDVDEKKLTVTMVKSTDTGLAFSAATADATYGGSFTILILSNPKSLAVTYKSSKTDVATVHATTGAVTIVGAGTTVISAEFAGNGTYEAATVSYTLTVAKAVPTVIAPVAIANLTANGTAQPLVTAGITTGGEMQYSLDGSTWSTAIPTATDAGTYTVHYKVVGNKNYKDVAEKKLTVTMAKSTVTGLAFSVATATATYGADFTAPTLTNPNRLAVTYKSSKTDVATVEGSTGAVAIVGAGIAIISAEFAGNGTYEAATVSYTLTVAKAVPTVTAPVAVANLTANGTALPLVNAGTTTGGEMQYSLDGSAWSTAIPTATDAGTYTIYYKVVGNKNYEDVAAKTLTVKMAKATATGLTFSSATAEATYGAAFTAPTLSNPKSLAVTYNSSDTEVAAVDATTGAVTIVGAGTAVINAVFAGNGTYEAVTVSYTLTVAKAVPVVTAPVAVANLTATGEALPLVTAGTTSAGEMQYSLDGSTWSTAIPTAVDAGPYTVYYKVVGNKNYEDVAAKTLTVTMAKATATGLTFSSPTAEATYGAAFTAPTLSNPNTLRVTYSSSNADVATVNSTTGAVTIAGAGTAVISAAFAGDNIYEATTVSYTLTVAKAVPVITAPVAVANLIANGTEQPLVTAGSTTGGEMQYSRDGSTWSTDIPTATEAGTYTVYYQVVGDKNYEDVATQSLKVTIARASATGLTFSSATAEATYGGSFTAPTLNNPKELPVTYNSSDTEVATVDAETGAVTIVGAGTAVINAVFAGNGIYEAVTVSYTLTVAKAVPTVTAPVAIDDLTADGSALALITAGTTTGGEMQYSLDGTAWSTDIPTATEAGTYTVYYQVVGGRNYEDVAAQSVSVTVAASSVVDDDVEVGDANGDGTINAADIVEVVNYIMGHPSEKFKAKGADANEDGTVNAADIVKIVNMIMAKSRMRMGAFGWEDTGVEDVFDDSAEPAIFDLQGHRLDSLRKGVNIIRDEHGRTKKIFVK